MSANNWGICPRCKALTLHKHEDAKLAAGQAYGKVSSEEYLRRLAAIPAEPELKTTFREDYELGTLEDGEFYVNYRGACSVCLFAHNFKHKETLPL